MPLAKLLLPLVYVDELAAKQLTLVECQHYSFCLLCVLGYLHLDQLTSSESCNETVQKLIPLVLRHLKPSSGLF